MKVKIEIDGIEISPNFSAPQSVQGCPGWSRVHAELEGLHFVGWLLGEHWELDVLSERPTSVNVSVDGSDAVPLYPGCGRGFLNSILNVTFPDSEYEDDIAKLFWNYHAALPFSEVDIAYTPTSGSPRNRFFGWIKEYKSNKLTIEQALWADKYLSFQLLRPYQDPSRGGWPACFSEFGSRKWGTPHYEGIGTADAGDGGHFTIRTLVDIYELWRLPRALDQAIRCLFSAMHQWPYYQDVWEDRPYSGSPRIAGWLMLALADGLRATRISGHGLLYDQIFRMAHDHINQQERIVNANPYAPLISAPDERRHIGVPFVCCWQMQVWAFALYELYKEVPHKRILKLAEHINKLMEDHGWDGQGTWYDSIPADPNDKETSPRPVGADSLGHWFAPAHISIDRDNSESLKAQIEVAKNSHWDHNRPFGSGVTNFERKSYLKGLDKFGPLIGGE